MTATTETLAPVQAKRRHARKLLTGVTGLSKEQQLERLGEAKETLAEAIIIVTERDHEAYQASKHQGLAGWLAHVTETHGVARDEFATDDVVATEQAYWFHKAFEGHDH